MKKQGHPVYYNDAVISCVCGNSLTIGSTAKSITVELCNACHPFYTGKQKLIDTAGRVEKFQKRASQKETLSATRKGKKVKRVTRAKKNSAEEQTDVPVK